MSSRVADIDEGRALVSRALVSYARKPDPEPLAHITDGLLRHGESLLPKLGKLRPDNEAAEQALSRALEDWHQAVGAGPADEPLGNWNYTRGIARIVRTFHKLLDTARDGSAAFVGRAGMPPLTAEQAAGRPQ